MIRAFNYLFFENEKDFLKNTRINDFGKRVFSGYSIAEPLSFPATFHYVGNYPGFAGDWTLVNKSEFSSRLCEEVTKLNELIKEIENS